MSGWQQPSIFLGDLQALKASGVTFVSSMLERVIEEQARGDASRAAAVRSAVVGVIGDDLANIKVRNCDVLLQIDGPDGFSLEGKSSLSKISRDPLDLAGQAIGANHRYPDGLMLFLGTMFAPTADRSQPGQGFTHVIGDIVTVHTPRLGALVNRVNHADKTEPWTFGVSALIAQLGS